MIEFKLNEKENECAEKFIRKHRHPETYKGSIGGHLQYVFTPTSVGVACAIKCKVCRDVENITDYSSW